MAKLIKQKKAKYELISTKKVSQIEVKMTNFQS